MAIDFDNLTDEELDEIDRKAEERREKRELEKKNEESSYSQLRDGAVVDLFERLKAISGDLVKVKTEVYEKFETVLQMKNELFGVKEEQMSHNWTSADGMFTIVTGVNHVDKYDETVSAGMAKVNDWLIQEASGINAKFVTVVRDLMKSNKEGLPRANRILDMQKAARDIGDPLLDEGVRIISNAHRSDTSTTYVKAKYKVPVGEGKAYKWVNLPLSFSQA